MPTVARQLFPDEAPTVPRPDTSSKLLAFASRVERLAELALERLTCDPDPDTLAAAVADVTELRALARGVLR